MDTNKAVTALSALAQETRLTVFRLLVEAGPRGVSAGDIASRLNCAPATLSFHLKELHRAELVHAERDGRSIIYSARFDCMQSLIDYLTENCCALDPDADCQQTALQCNEMGNEVENA